MKGIKRRKIELFNSLECNGLIRKLRTGEYRLYAEKNWQNYFTQK